MFGRGREQDEATSPESFDGQPSGIDASGPSSARTVLPGVPFEPPVQPVPAAEHASTQPIPAATTASAFEGAFAAADSTPTFGGSSYPGAFGATSTAAAGTDPIDALQGYAGLPFTQGQPEGFGSESLDNPFAGATYPYSTDAPATPVVPGQFGQSGTFGADIPPPAEPISFDKLPEIPVQPAVPAAAPAADEAPAKHKRRRGSRRAGADAPSNDAPSNDAPKRKGSAGRKVAALVGSVAILGAAGFVAYTQAGGNSDSSGTVTPAHSRTAPRAAAGAAPVAFTPPHQLAEMELVTGPQATQLTNLVRGAFKQEFPQMPTPSVVAGYRVHGRTDPDVTVGVFAPGKGGPDALFQQLLTAMRTPSQGDVAVPDRLIAPGAAGGVMRCGTERGPQGNNWCAWRSGKSVGFLQTPGTQAWAFSVQYTRELRAAGEK